MFLTCRSFQVDFKGLLYIKLYHLQIKIFWLLLSLNFSFSVWYFFGDSISSFLSWNVFTISLHCVFSQPTLGDLFLSSVRSLNVFMVPIFKCLSCALFPRASCSRVAGLWWKHPILARASDSPLLSRHLEWGRLGRCWVLKSGLSLLDRLFCPLVSAALSGSWESVWL